MTNQSATTADAAADLARQVGELNAMLEAGKDIVNAPALIELLSKTIADVTLYGSAVLANQVQIAVGDTYLTLVEMLDRLLSQLLGIQEDAIGWHADQETATAAGVAARAVQTASIAAVVLSVALLKAEVLRIKEQYITMSADILGLKQAHMQARHEPPHPPSKHA